MSACPRLSQDRDRNHRRPAQAVALIIDNKPQSRPFDFTKFIVTVQEIEERTGFNFMPGLDPGDRVRLETQKGMLFK
jgi:DNA/RNA endonuclease G (NUC1)